MRTDDGNIIYECLDGEPGAFGVLVDKYKAGIYAFIYDKLRDFQDAQDVTQETFLQAYRNLRTLRRWESFSFWLYRIARNQCGKWLRARSRCPDSEFIEDQHPKALAEASLSVYRDSQIEESLREALDSLSEAHREVLMLHYFGGMTIKNIARAIGASPSAIGSRLSRARAQLKEEMLAMMDTAFDEKRLQASFTLRIVEAMKHIKIHPMPRIAGLPWGLSLAAGIIVAVLGLNPRMNVHNFMPIPAHSSPSHEAQVLKVSEIPVDVLTVSQVPLIANGQSRADSDILEPMNEPSPAQAAEEDTWKEKADMLTPRNNLSATVMDGMVYVIGGRSAVADLPTVEKYDPATDTWTRKADMLSARRGLATCAVNGKIYAAGGFIDNPAVEEYDPETDTWIEKTGMPGGPRAALRAAAVNGKIYIIGGWANVPLSIVEEYDPTKDKWTRKTDMPTARYAFGIAVVNERIYAIGGKVGAPQDPTSLSTVEEYDPATDTWAEEIDMPTARRGVATCAVDGKIYAIGGTTEKGINTSAVEEYDPVTDTWSKGEDMPTQRGLAVAGVVNGKIYVIGGGNEQVDPVSAVEEYTPRGWRPTSISPQLKLPTMWGKAKL